MVNDNLLNFNESTAIISGNNFDLVQFSAIDIDQFVASFIQNYLHVHNDLLGKKIDFDFSHEKNLLLDYIGSSICLGIKRGEDCLITLMITKRGKKRTFSEDHFGIDLEDYFGDDNLDKYNCYEISKFTANKEALEIYANHLSCIRLVVFVAFKHMEADNTDVAFCNVNKLSNSVMDILGIKYKQVTAPILFRDTPTKGVVIPRDGIGEFVARNSESKLYSLL